MKNVDEGETFRATIDRISGAGNGIIEIPGGAINLGPIKKSAVGETIQAEKINDQYARCLTDHARASNYRESLERLVSGRGLGVTQKDIDDLQNGNPRTKGKAAVRLVGKCHTENITEAIPYLKDIIRSDTKVKTKGRAASALASIACYHPEEVQGIEQDLDPLFGEGNAGISAISLLAPLNAHSYTDKLEKILINTSDGREWAAARWTLYSIRSEDQENVFSEHIGIVIPHGVSSLITSIKNGEIYGDAIDIKSISLLLDGNVSTENKDEIKNLISDMLEDNPELIDEIEPILQEIINKGEKSTAEYAASILDTYRDRISENSDESSIVPISITGDGSEANKEISEQKPLEKLRKKAEKEATTEPSPIRQKSKAAQEYTRSQAVKDYVKARADGVCEACGEPSPFISKTGDPYLHAHHIHELSDGGSDTIDTVIALCPNCHYRVHHGMDGDDFNRELLKTVQELEG